MQQTESRCCLKLLHLVRCPPSLIQSSHPLPLPLPLFSRFYTQQVQQQLTNVLCSVGIVHLLMLPLAERFWKLPEGFKVMWVRTVLLLLTRSEKVIETAYTSGIVTRFGDLVEYILRPASGAQSDICSERDVLLEILRVFFKFLDVPEISAESGIKEADDIILRIASAARTIFLQTAAEDGEGMFALRDAAVHVLMNTPETMATHCILGRPCSMVVGGVDSSDDEDAAAGDAAANLLNGFVVHLEHQLERASLPSADADTSAAAICPVAAVLSSAAAIAREARRALRDKLLPRIVERSELGPGNGSTISDKLIKLLTSPNDNVRQSVSTLLFTLANENAARFVRRVGFGNAAGFLQGRGIFQPETLGNGSCDNDSDTDSDGESGGDIEDYDPVTGGAWRSAPSDMEPMTDEQKEWEAHQL